MKPITKETRMAEEYESSYKQCGLCGRIIFDGFAARYEHLDSYHKMNKDAVHGLRLITSIEDKIFHGVLVKEEDKIKIRKLKNEKRYLGLDLDHVYDMRSMIDYSDDLYEKTKQHYGYSQNYSGVD